MSLHVFLQLGLQVGAEELCGQKGSLPWKKSVLGLPPSPCCILDLLPVEPCRLRTCLAPASSTLALCAFTPSHIGQALPLDRTPVLAAFAGQAAASKDRAMAGYIEQQVGCTAGLHVWSVGGERLGWSLSIRPAPSPLSDAAC